LWVLEGTVICLTHLRTAKVRKAETLLRLELTRLELPHAVLNRKATGHALWDKSSLRCKGRCSKALLVCTGLETILESLHHGKVTKAASTAGSTSEACEAAEVTATTGTIEGIAAATAATEATLASSFGPLLRSVECWGSNKHKARLHLVLLVGYNRRSSTGIFKADKGYALVARRDIAV